MKLKYLLQKLNKKSEIFMCFLKDILRGRLGIHATSINCRRDSAAQMTTIDATLMDTTSLGKTASDPVDETKTGSQPEYHGKSNSFIIQC